MEAVIIVDPMEYQRRRDEAADPLRPLRTPRFAPGDRGVTFLINQPHDLVLVVKTQWLGD